MHGLVHPDLITGMGGTTTGPSAVRLLESHRQRGFGIHFVWLCVQRKEVRGRVRNLLKACDKIEVKHRRTFTQDFPLLDHNAGAWIRVTVTGFGGVHLVGIPQHGRVKPSDFTLKLKTGIFVGGISLHHQSGDAVFSHDPCSPRPRSASYDDSSFSTAWNESVRKPTQKFRRFQLP